MNILTKLYKAFVGLLLMIRYKKLFDPSLLAGKRVAIVGPASSAYQTNRGDFIDGFDFVIRINKAPILLKKGTAKADVGSKTDILFHSFIENEFSGGGALDFALYDELGIRYVINPIPTYFGNRVTFNFYKKYLLNRVVYHLPKAPYMDAIKAFGKYRPTTGFCALKMAIESDCSELFITGFTFFKTAYGDGYRDSLKDVQKNIQYINESNIHSPDIEYTEFTRMLKENKNKRIFTDHTLRQILQQDGVAINEVQP
jgi:hypothetical protein